MMEVIRPMDEEYQRYRVEQAHAYLERIRQSGDDCAGLQQLVDDARDRASRLTGMDYAKPVVSTSPSADAMPESMDTILALIREYTASLAAYESMRNEAREALWQMDNQTDAKVLMLRYLLCRSWESICVETNYTYDGMMKLRRRALADFYEVMPRGERDPFHPAL